MCMNSSSLQLMHFGFPVLVRSLFLLNLLEIKACIMTKLMACLTLKPLCWALEPFKMSRISTLVTSIFVLVHKSRVKTLLEMTCLHLFCILVLDLFLLDWGFPLLILSVGNSVHWWHIRLIWTAWGSPATYLMCLAVALELSTFLASWHTLLVGNLSRSTLP